MPKTEELFKKQSGPEWSCVDGRPAILILKRQSDETWEIAFRGPEAGQRKGPQVLGASLGFVAAAEMFAGLSADEAFNLVEKAHQELGFEPQYHIDNHHFSHVSPDGDLLAMSDEEIISFVLKTLEGCGFAKYHYGDSASSYLQMAQDHGWSIQVLGGGHLEAGASKNHVEGKTFDTYRANELGGEAIGFNQDVADVRAVLGKMGQLLNLPDFASEAAAWLDVTYNDVVKTLTSGRVQPSDIKEIR